VTIIDDADAVTDRPVVPPPRTTQASLLRCPPSCDDTANDEPCGGVTARSTVSAANCSDRATPSPRSAASPLGCSRCTSPARSTGGRPHPPAPGALSRRAWSRRRCQLQRRTAMGSHHGRAHRRSRRGRRAFRLAMSNQRYATAAGGSTRRGEPDPITPREAASVDSPRSCRGPLADEKDIVVRADGVNAARTETG
jgi:hypothetical protein